MGVWEVLSGASYHLHGVVWKNQEHAPKEWRGHSGCCPWRENVAQVPTLGPHPSEPQGCCCLHGHRHMVILRTTRFQNHLVAAGDWPLWLSRAAKLEVLVAKCREVQSCFCGVRVCFGTTPSQGFCFIPGFELRSHSWWCRGTLGWHKALWCLEGALGLPEAGCVCVCACVL